MTPTQLRAFAAIVRLGSSKAAAGELSVSEAAVSGHVSALRKELGDELFVRTGSGISFTPGGLRLASRAVEMLGLQDQTRHEVRAAAGGQRVLRLGVSSILQGTSQQGIQISSKGQGCVHGTKGRSLEYLPSKGVWIP